MSKFIEYVSCFQDDYDQKEMHYIISNVVEKSIELSKEYEELYYKVIQDVQVVYVAFATEPFEEYEFDEWLNQQMYEEEEEEMFKKLKVIIINNVPAKHEQERVMWELNL
jgi:hypothetical protein